jgi:hypothetical protein
MTRVVFDTSSADKFVQARATSINSGIPGAIFRFATQQLNGAQATFDDPSGFLDITKRVYVIGLCESLSTLSINGSWLTDAAPRHRSQIGILRSRQPNITCANDISRTKVIHLVRDSFS